MIDFDELERLCREAESGEWRTHGPSKPQPDAPEGGDFAIICGSDIIAETFYRSGYETTHNARANAEFIAALRNAAPELIAMARRWQALDTMMRSGPDARVFLDGNSWCAVHPDFVNLQESPAGFGNTPEDARKALIQEQRR